MGEGVAKVNKTTIMNREIVLSGGWDNRDQDPMSKFGVYAGMIYRYREEVVERIGRGEKVGVVTLAKDDGAYEEHLGVLGAGGEGSMLNIEPASTHPDFDSVKPTPLKEGILQIIDYSTDIVEWSEFDLLLILGGDSLRLKQALEERGFALERLKTNAKVVGDSAGAQILSAWFYHRDHQDPNQLTFHQGFGPNSMIILVVHNNNSRYVSPELRSAVDKFAQEKELEVIKLKENEET